MAGPVGDDRGERAGAGAPLADQGLDAGARHGVSAASAAANSPASGTSSAAMTIRQPGHGLIAIARSASRSSPTVPSSRVVVAALASRAAASCRADCQLREQRVLQAEHLALLARARAWS